MNVDAVNAVPIVGGPFAYGLGFAALVAVVFGGPLALSFVTIAHEGGHWAMGALTFRKPGAISLEDNANGATKMDVSWGAGAILTAFAGYATPPLLGLGGATLIQHGKAWSVLWAAVVLFAAALLQSEGLLSTVICVVAAAGCGWAAADGTPKVQAGVAVGVVWWMLFGGIDQAVRLSRAEKSDPWFLARYTWVPKIVWHGLWIFIAVICLWIGARRLLAL